MIILRETVSKRLMASENILLVILFNHSTGAQHSNALPVPIIFRGVTWHIYIFI